MRVLIVDDEPAARQRLRRLLTELGVEVAGEAKNGVEALALCAELVPEVLLLDVAMPEVDGFDVVRHLSPPAPLVIFQTAYDDFALRAFDAEALDYLVKPVEKARLERALERARRRLAEGERGVSRRAMQRVEGALRELAARRRPRILVCSGRGHRLLALAEIAFFVARDGAVYAHGPEVKHLTDYTLTELEERTRGSFLRVSRSALVNLEHVEHIVSAGDGSAVLTLTGGRELRVSRRRASQVRQRLADG